MTTHVAARTLGFSESVIREMTRLITKERPEDGINLAQGFPDFPAPEEVKRAAVSAIENDVNQYAITWGSKAFRDAISSKTRHFTGIEVDPENEITVTCGATEGMISAMLAIVDPGDEVIVFEPFYENYGPDCILSGATPRYIPLRPPDWSFDWDELTAAFGPRTKGIVINTPNNPTGKVFTEEELRFIGGLCEQWDCYALTDEIYEHMVYDGATHVSMASLPEMKSRTIAVNGLSKTFSVTGWRVGYVIAPPRVTAAIRKVHDFLTVGAPAPLQAAGAIALAFPDAYYADLCAAYQQRRDLLVDALRRNGFKPFVPKGAYYIMSDISAFHAVDDTAFAHHLIREAGVAVVPGSSFYHEPALGHQQVRFAFPKKMETLTEAASRLGRFRLTPES